MSKWSTAGLKLCVDCTEKHLRALVRCLQIMWELMGLQTGSRKPAYGVGSHVN